MLFGRHINRYYLRYFWIILPGLLSLVVVDYLQLIIPELYRMVVNGLNEGAVILEGVSHPFDLDFLKEE